MTARFASFVYGRMVSVDVLRMCAVLQDCADQLAVLGNIMRDTQGNGKRRQRLKAGSKLSDVTAELHRSQKQLSIEDSPLTPDDLAKVQRDRQVVSEVINRLIVELQERQSSLSLFSAVEEERRRKAQLLDILNRQEEGRLRTESLKKHLLDIRKEQKEECERLKESIVLLRHEVQKMRMRTEWQGTFVKSCAQQLLCQGQKISGHKEKELEDEVRMLQDRSEEEKHVNVEIEAFLKRQHTSLQEKMQFWIKRYEKDLEQKEQELTSLHNKRANNLTQLQELSKKCRDMQQVIIEDRTEKEQLRIQMEKEKRERDAATKIQAWWRGTVVRRGLASPKKADKSKPKKGKKKKK